MRARTHACSCVRALRCRSGCVASKTVASAGMPSAIALHTRVFGSDGFTDDRIASKKSHGEKPVPAKLANAMIGRVAGLKVFSAPSFSHPVMLPSACHPLWAMPIAACPCPLLASLAPSPPLQQAHVLAMLC